MTSNYAQWGRCINAGEFSFQSNPVQGITLTDANRLIKEVHLITWPSNQLIPSFFPLLFWGLTKFNVVGLIYRMKCAVQLSVLIGVFTGVLCRSLLDTNEPQNQSLPDARDPSSVKRGSGTCICHCLSKVLWREQLSIMDYEILYFAIENLAILKYCAPSDILLDTCYNS